MTIYFAGPPGTSIAFVDAPPGVREQLVDGARPRRDRLLVVQDSWRPPGVGHAGPQDLEHRGERRLVGDVLTRRLSEIGGVDSDLRHRQVDSCIPGEIAKGQGVDLVEDFWLFEGLTQLLGGVLPRAMEIGPMTDRSVAVWLLFWSGLDVTCSPLTVYSLLLGSRVGNLDAEARLVRGHNAIFRSTHTAANYL
jgi:hypothetical protein